MDFIALFSSQNFDLVTVGIATAAIAILGLSVFLANQKSATSRAFLFFALSIVAYAICNYLSSNINDPFWTLLLLRSTIFFATWASLLMFQLFLVFPDNEHKLSRWYTRAVVPLVGAVSLLTLSPFVFTSVASYAVDGNAAAAGLGFGMPIFGLSTLILVIGAIFLLVKKLIQQWNGLSRDRLLFVTIGTAITFIGILVFNVVLPLTLRNTHFLIFAPVWFFPFIALTSYSILKLKLFDVKTAAVSVLSFLLAATIIAQAIFTTSIPARVFSASQFVLVVVFSLWLIKATTKEVEQRQHIEMLAKELQTANDRLKELDKLKSEFLSIATHELRTPLTIVRNFVSLLLDGSYGPLPPAAAESGKQVFDRVTDMAGSVDNYLNVSRIEQGRMKYDFVDGDFTDLVKKAVEAMRPNAVKKNLALTLTVSPGAEALKAKMDIGKVNEVITNLIDNSIKYTPTGSIALTIEKVGTAGRVVIKDTGVGMSAKTMAGLFKLFSPGEDSKKINPASTGVGLYISRAHIEAHKGTLTATSPGVNQGSVFTINLPGI